MEQFYKSCVVVARRVGRAGRSGEPMNRVYAAVARKDFKGFPGGLASEEAVSRDKALRCSDMGAYAVRRKGARQVRRKTATDSVIADIMKIPEVEI